MRIFWMAIFLGVGLCTSVLADEPKKDDALTQEVEYLDGVMKRVGQSVHHSLQDFYGGIVHCFRTYPIQKRGYPGNFRGCLLHMRNRITTRFNSALTGQKLTSQLPVLLNREILRHHTVKLDAILRAKTDSEFGILDVSAKMMDSIFTCAKNASTTAPKACIEKAAWRSIQDIGAIHGEPGASRSFLDLAYTSAPPPPVQYVARFNDVGQYYRFPHDSCGLPPGQFYNHNIPVIRPPFFSGAMIYNGLISQMLFGWAFFGNYGWGLR